MRQTESGVYGNSLYYHVKIFCKSKTTLSVIKKQKGNENPLQLHPPGYCEYHAVQPSLCIYNHSICVPTFIIFFLHFLK